ncbi:-family transcriptional regulatory protein : Transcriptional regulator, TetR family OS=Thermincola potens (strain JR) GN=TherJR_0193 PE=4 SV=1: TetR_N: TetR_C_6 [Gemmataceae bacterium]|nr:-family transcriptional regulatory protein : Transcriptional regulator, TetR family OS=Thermincola potens (strain JR) GN=TherJR_0193 PE=4 SV=1: TetR_N: TetR_C_6 [Gemmataceae bacterium]VTU01840.1 -family transcriptional regulatory protein : Transcriptional regulator, TetR family OS=Thermincola potens (strain JR) GN=TherJR_0193 PE=4 SV=1: TetR_N: TetR_C_6 [Gemmataceae bacterium]
MSDTLPPPEPRPAGVPACVWDTEPPGLTDTARKRREEIMVAAEAVLADDGIDELSLKKVEDRAGMSRGQLTYYFPTRESILLAVYDRMIRRMIRAFLDSDGPKPMTGRAWDCFRFGLSKHLEPAGEQQGKELFTLLFTFLARMNQRPEYRDKLSEMYREWRDHIAADVADSVPEPRPIDPRAAASLFQALIQGLQIQLMIDPEAFDRAAVLDACTRLLAPVFKQGPVA